MKIALQKFALFAMPKFATTEAATASAATPREPSWFRAALGFGISLILLTVIAFAASAL
jgi:hypothetical protein